MNNNFLMFNSFFKTLELFFYTHMFKYNNKIQFQTPASPLMERIVVLHNWIFAFIIAILVLVIWLLLVTIDITIISPVITYKKLFSYGGVYLLATKFIGRNYGKYYIRYNKPLIKYIIVIQYFFSFFNLLCSGIRHEKFTSNKDLELIWTIVPCIILILIGIPSFYVLYLNDEVIFSEICLKVISHQWYWSYDFNSFWFPKIKVNNNIIFSSKIEDMVFDSYMEPEEYLNIKRGSFRLLETDNPLILPSDSHIKILVTSDDVLHSFAVPCLGVKIDAVPGRLNQIEIFIRRIGVFFGQCSEICGIGHGFMPIEIFVLPKLNYLNINFF